MLILFIQVINYNWVSNLENYLPLYQKSSYARFVHFIAGWSWGKGGDQKRQKVREDQFLEERLQFSSSYFNNLAGFC